MYIYVYYIYLNVINEIEKVRYQLPVLCTSPQLWAPYFSAFLWFLLILISVLLDIYLNCCFCLESCRTFAWLSTVEEDFLPSVLHCLLLFSPDVFLSFAPSQVGGFWFSHGPLSHYYDMYILYIAGPYCPLGSHFLSSWICFSWSYWVSRFACFFVNLPLSLSPDCLPLWLCFNTSSSLLLWSLFLEAFLLGPPTCYSGLNLFKTCWKVGVVGCPFSVLIPVFLDPWSHILRRNSWV